MRWNHLLMNIAQIDSNIYMKLIFSGLQLTVFQSIEEQDEFLKNHNPKERQKWEKWFIEDFIPLVVERTEVDYLYLDLKDSKIKPVYPT